MTASSAGMARSRQSLLLYRVLAFATGVVLLVASVTLILQYTVDDSIKDSVGWIWVLHGYLYIVYLIATVNLGIRMRWNIVRMVLVALAGTIPTMSFVAEHFVTRDVRSKMEAQQPMTARGNL